MPARSPMGAISGRPADLRTVMVAGGTAGVLATPAGAMKVGDEIVSVSRFTTATFAPGTDITAEFITPVAVVDQINNTGGSNTTGQLLLVTYARANVKLG